MSAVRSKELLALLGVALCVRLAVAWFLPNIHVPDEIYQGFEQAHRLVFGYGIIPWEWRIGARSWLLPGFLAGIFSGTRHFTDDPRVYVFVARAVLALLSCALVVVGYLWGLRFARAHGLLAGVALAVWFELVYFSGKPLTEVVATNFLVVGLFLGVPRPIESPVRMFGAGVLLGIAVVLRFHLGPAVTVAAIACCGLRFRDRWVPLAVGGLLPIMALGVLDTVTWGRPFHSILENFRINIVESRSHRYGVAPMSWYAYEMVKRWGGAVFILSVLIVMGTRRAPLLFLTATTIVLTHVVIAHKEYRFLYPAIACAIVLAGFGSAELMRTLQQAGRTIKTTAIVVACLGWLVTSLTLARQPEYRSFWRKERPALEAALLARESTAMCGIGLGGDWGGTGGYTYLHRNVPTYVLNPDAVASDWAAVNVALILAAYPSASIASGFTRWGCFGDSGQGVCVYRRDGACTGQDGRADINQWLRAHDQ